MPGAQQEISQPVEPQGQEPLDWAKLASSLGAHSGTEAQRRAYEIAKFVADVENDPESQLILKTGRKQLELKLNQ